MVELELAAFRNPRELTQFQERCMLRGQSKIFRWNWGGGGVIALLVAASLVVRIVRKTHPVQVGSLAVVDRAFGAVREVGSRGQASLVPVKEGIVG